MTRNMMPKVFWLETASHIVRLLTGFVLDGMMNENIENPAVRMTAGNCGATKNKGSLLFFSIRTE